jgi:predicted enzyme related to lactoylglutathione lyase
MDVEVAFTGIAVSGMAAARAFYDRVFGRGPDIVASDDEVMWRLTDSAWLYVLVDPARAGSCLVTTAVEDLDAALAELDARSVAAEQVEEMDAGRKATLRDPDGNTVAIIEVFERR